MNVETILSQIELGNYALPEFQRGYVWNRDQVRKLMNSLYRGYRYFTDTDTFRKYVEAYIQ